MSLLVVSGLNKTFGGVVAAKDVSFSVEAGELVAMIGPNGAGKSTTFNMVGGQLMPDSGSVTLDGTPITGLSPRMIFHRGVARTFQVAQTFLSMSVTENVQMALIAEAGASFTMLSSATDFQRQAALEALHQVGMAQAAEQPVRELAYGDVKRVELAMALVTQPRLLLMDEPTAGMGAEERDDLMALVASLAKRRGIGVLFTEHDMDAVFTHADRILVLVRGKLIAQGTPDEVKHNDIVRKAYLGTTGLMAIAEAKP